MIIDELMEKLLPKIPAEIAKQIDERNLITLTEFENKNEILTNLKLQQEIGYSRFPDGSYLVSMICPMPNIQYPTERIGNIKCL